MAAHHRVGGREGPLDVAAHSLPAQQVLGRRVRVDDRVERLVLDLDELGGVLRERARLGQHGRHRLARVTDLVVREQRVRLVGAPGPLGQLDRQRAGMLRDVRRGQHRGQALGRCPAPGSR